MGHRQQQEQEQQQQQQCGANGFSSRYTRLQWLQTLLFDIWNFFPPPSTLFLPPSWFCLGFFSSSSCSMIEGWATLQLRRRKSVTRLNIDICFLLVPVLPPARMWPHMIWRRGLDRTLTQSPPPQPQSPIWFHWCMYTLCNYNNGSCHHQSVSHGRDLVSYQTRAAGQTLQSSPLTRCCYTKKTKHACLASVSPEPIKSQNMTGYIYLF